MDGLEIALEPLAGTFDHILQIDPDNLLAGNEAAVPFPVHHFLQPVRIAHPPLQVVEHAKTFVDVAQMEQPPGLIAEPILDLLALDSYHRHGAGQDQGFCVLVLNIQIGHIVDLIPLEHLGNGVTGQLLKVCVVQIDACGGVRGAKVNSQRHPAL